MVADQPTNDFDEHEHGEDASSAAYDAERRAEDAYQNDMAEEAYNALKAEDEATREFFGQRVPIARGWGLEPQTFLCDQCSQEKPEDSSRSNEEVTVCADCCAKNDAEFFGRRI